MIGVIEFSYLLCHIYWMENKVPKTFERLDHKVGSAVVTRMVGDGLTSSHIERTSRKRNGLSGIRHRSPKNLLNDLAILWRKSEKAISNVEALEIGLDDLKTRFSPRFDDEEISNYILPTRTLARRKKANENLNQIETDRALRLARIVVEADRIFGDSAKADGWLRSPNRNFSGQTPLSLLKSEAGGILVEQVLGQIDHGMFA